MKKKYKYLVSLMMLLLVVSGCSSKERDGVPEHLILSSDAYYGFYEEYGSVSHRIMHNINTDSHTDTVTLELTTDTCYAMRTVQLTYQYNRSDDNWSLISEQNKFMVPEFNIEAIKDASPWVFEEGSSQRGDERIIKIYVDDIDMEMMNISITYDIDFLDDSYVDIVQSETVVEELNQQTYAGGVVHEDYLITIDVPTTGCEEVDEYGIALFCYLNKYGLIEKSLWEIERN